MSENAATVVYAGVIERIETNDAEDDEGKPNPIPAGLLRPSVARISAVVIESAAGLLTARSQQRTPVSPDHRKPGCARPAETSACTRETCPFCDGWVIHPILARHNRINADARL